MRSGRFVGPGLHALCRQLQNYLNLIFLLHLLTDVLVFILAMIPFSYIFYTTLSSTWVQFFICFQHFQSIIMAIVG